MSSDSVVLVAPVRTAIGMFGGSLKETPAAELGAVAIKAAIREERLGANLRIDAVTSQRACAARIVRQTFSGVAGMSI